MPDASAARMLLLIVGQAAACLGRLGVNSQDVLTVTWGYYEHGRSETHFAPMPPDAVVFAESTEEVVAAVNLCREAGVPIIPFGAGTSVEGNTLAVQGGVSLDLSRMTRIVAVNTDDFDCVVEAGVRREQLNEYLRDQGLFFPIDPGANATIGGMASTRASGTRATPVWSSARPES